MSESKAWEVFNKYIRDNIKKENEMKVLEMVTDGVGMTQHNIGEAIIAVNNDSAWEMLNLSPNTRYACCMIPIPDGYRLATEDDNLAETRGLKMKQGLCTDDWSNIIDPTGIDGSVYAVPIKSEKDAKVDEIKDRLRLAELAVQAIRGEMDGLK